MIMQAAKLLNLFQLKVKKSKNMKCFSKEFQEILLSHLQTLGNLSTERDLYISCTSTLHLHEYSRIPNPTFTSNSCLMVYTLAPCRGGMCSVQTLDSVAIMQHQVFIIFADLNSVLLVDVLSPLRICIRDPCEL